MIDDDVIRKQLDNTLRETDLGIGNKRYVGKVRDNYYFDDKIFMVTSDRVSAFDHVLGTIPFKGQVLNQIALFWFDKTKDIVENHVIDSPDPNCMLVRKCKPIPVEMIVRGYITGSLWRDYNSGKRDMYGLNWPDGLKKQQEINVVVTPSTKEEYGKHDMPISKSEIIEKGIVGKERYEEMERVSLELFRRGSEVALKNGMILVDTKYEFGIVNDNLVLMDEVHTPDSSRYWLKEKYEELFLQGLDQERLDKEYLRKWLISKGFMGEGVPPVLDDEIRVGLAKIYIELFEKMTGKEFLPETTSVLDRIKKNIDGRW